MRINCIRLFLSTESKVIDSEEGDLDNAGEVEGFVPSSRPSLWSDGTSFESVWETSDARLWRSSSDGLSSAWRRGRVYLKTQILVINLDSVSDYMLTSFNPTKPITNVRNATMPVTKHGKKYGCVTKKCPNECGHLVAGLLKMPPMIGLWRRSISISRAFQVFHIPECDSSTPHDRHQGESIAHIRCIS